MSNLSIKINLTKIPGAGVVELKGKSGAVKKCVYIPIEGADLYVGEKGVYLNTIAFEVKERKYSDTHFIKQSLSKEKYEALTEQQKKDMPIIGGVQPKQNAMPEASTEVSQETTPGESPSDLPF